jgi:hypothetical protein
VAITESVYTVEMLFIFMEFIQCTSHYDPVYAVGALLNGEKFMQTEKIELETTVVDETKERESYCAQANRMFSGECCVNIL